MIIEQKKKIVEDIKKKFETAKIVINTDYQGLDVATITDLRSRLKEASVEFKVIKNTFLEKAAIDTGIEVIKDSFKGPSAVAFTDNDPVEAARILIKFSEEKPNFKIKVAAMNGKFLDSNDIKALSLLPSREVLLSLFLSALNGVPGGFVRTLNAIPTGLVNVLQALKEKIDDDDDDKS